MDTIPEEFCGAAFLIWGRISLASKWQYWQRRLLACARQCARAAAGTLQFADLFVHIEQMGHQELQVPTEEGNRKVV